MKKFTLQHLTLTAFLIGFLALIGLELVGVAPAGPTCAQAQVWTAMEPVTLAGGWAGDGVGKDTLYQNGYVIHTKALDSLHAFIEYSDSVYCRLLGAAVHATLDEQDSAALVKDTVCIKAFSATKAGTKGITWQDLKQAWGGAVPPDFKLYLYADRDGTGRAAGGGEAAITAKEFEKP